VRSGSFDQERFCQACQLQFHRSLDGGACPDTDVLLVIAVESWKLDVEYVWTRRKSGEAQLALWVRRMRRRPANQRRRADTDDRTRQDPSLCVLDGSDEGAGQPLRDGHAWEKEDGDTDEDQAALLTRGGRPTALAVHMTAPVKTASRGSDRETAPQKPHRRVYAKRIICRHRISSSANGQKANENAGREIAHSR
jgi:hypothetical protein